MDEGRRVDVAWRLLLLASQRRAGLGDREVLSPRAPEVVRKLGYEDRDAPELVQAEGWLEARGYIAPVDTGPAGGTFRLTPDGWHFLEKPPRP